MLPQLNTCGTFSLLLTPRCNLRCETRKTFKANFRSTLDTSQSRVQSRTGELGQMHFIFVDRKTHGISTCDHTFVSFIEANLFQRGGRTRAILAGCRQRYRVTAALLGPLQGLPHELGRDPHSTAGVVGAQPIKSAGCSRARCSLTPQRLPYRQRPHDAASKLRNQKELLPQKLRII